MDKPVLIEARQASLLYQDGEQVVQAVREVSLRVHRGEFIGIEGPSGSGKSSLLYLLSGLKMPTTGTVTYQGRRYTEMSDAERSAIRRTRFLPALADNIHAAQSLDELQHKRLRLLGITIREPHRRLPPTEGFDGARWVPADSAHGAAAGHFAVGMQQHRPAVHIRRQHHPLRDDAANQRRL